MQLVSRLKDYILSKPDAVEDYPFGAESVAYKVADKMFAVMFAVDPIKINLKCDPVEALELRSVFQCVLPGYHMNKKHWNTVILDGSLPESELCRMIDISYSLVVKGLRKNTRSGLEMRFGYVALYGYTSK